jgi:outer membrane protein OmpA-like peptidoglycan-associated protein
MGRVMFGKCSSLRVLFSLCGVCLLGACGAGPAPKEVLTARDAFQQAKAVQAAELAPVQLEEARQALVKADAAFEDEGDAPETRYLAYVAERRAEVAKSSAQTEAARRAKIRSEEELQALQQGIQEATESKLAKTKEQLERERRDKQELSKDMEAERKARLAAEQKLSAALASLEKIAQVKEEQRGVVITLSGSVLFATGKSELLPIAQDRLGDVAKAVKDQGYKRIIVEGHTDSVGSASANLELSRRRAEAVRSFLVSRGIESNKIEAVGIGKDRPVAENSTPEGRANNRRVELVVTPEK